MREIHTRASAKAAGLKKYWTGKNCERGHASLRYTNTGACAGCIAHYRTVRAQRKGKARAVGAVLFTVKAHPDDRAQIEAIAAALALDRAMAATPAWEGAPLEAGNPGKIPC